MPQSPARFRRAGNAALRAKEARDGPWRPIRRRRAHRRCCSKADPERSRGASGRTRRSPTDDNYYVARANALEHNVSLYYTERDRRITLKYVDAPVPANTWHTLRVEFAGSRIKVIFDEKPYIELDDSHIPGPGAVGVWTKADSVTAFDDFSYGAR